MAISASAPLLVAEDNDEDFEILQLALKELGFSRPILRFEDGDQVLAYLFRYGRFQAPESSPRPALLILDLNLPETDGREVLSQLKAHPKIGCFPIVVFSTSDNPRDVSLWSCNRSALSRDTSSKLFTSAVNRVA